MDVNRFHVITVISNACRYRSRVNLYKAFAKHVAESGVQLWTVEAAFGDRPHEVTERGNPHHIQLRTRTEIWHKENMQSLCLARLPHDWEVACCIDADVEFVRKKMTPSLTGPLAGQAMVAEWAMETWHQLQHHDVVQMWSTACDLGPRNQTFATAKSFGAYMAEGLLPNLPSKYGYAHSGYAWAYHRRGIDKMMRNVSPSGLSNPKTGKATIIDGPWITWAPLGSADFYQAWGIINELSPRLYQDVADSNMRKRGFHPDYAKSLIAWQDVAQCLHKDIGVVEGTILHYWHGKKKQRQYNTRENILIEHKFNPFTDLVKDHQGLWTWSDTVTPAFRDDMRRYSRQRDEDSNDM